MEKLLQLLKLARTSSRSFNETTADDQDAVFYETSSEAVSFISRANAEEMNRNQENDEYYPSDEGTLTTTALRDNKDYKSVLLDDKARSSKEQSGSSCCSSCNVTYRSSDPEKRVTPFAVTLLAVLFLIYVVNQADRLVLPVAIPSGLRCEASVKDECRNESSYAVNSTQNASNNSDCIHFTDNEQGLLTGKGEMQL